MRTILTLGFVILASIGLVEFVLWIDENIHEMIKQLRGGRVE